jgi:putative membrane protein
VINLNEKMFIGILAIGAVATLSMGGWGMGSHMWGPGMMGGWGGMGFGMGITWILVLIGLFLLFGYQRYDNRHEDRAKTIARERYARGEISEQEFEEIMKKL